MTKTLQNHILCCHIFQVCATEQTRKRMMKMTAAAMEGTKLQR